MAYNAEKNEVKTGICRISYAHVFEAKAFDEKSTPKYSCSLLIPKTDTATVRDINAAIDKVKEDSKAKLWGGKIPKDYNPLIDGDESDNGDEKGCWILRASRNEEFGRPLIFSRRPAPQGSKYACDLITDPEELYSGCYCFFVLRFGGYNYNNVKKGVSAYLEQIQKRKDGERLGGGGFTDGAFAADDEDDGFLD